MSAQSIIATGFFLAVFLFHSIVVERNYRNPLSIFFGLYSVILFLGGLKLFGMREFDQGVYWIVVIGGVAFLLGYDLLRFSGVRFHLGRTNRQVSYRLSEKALLYATGVLCVFYLVIAVRVMSFILFRGFTPADIRMIYANGTEAQKIAYIYGSGLIKTSELLFVRPVYFSVVVLSIVRFFSKQKMDLQIKLAVLLVALYTLIDFSRMVLLVLVVQILVCGLMTSKIRGNSILRIIRKYVAPAMIVLGIVLYFLSTMRIKSGSGGNSFMESLYSYFAIPLPLLANQIEQIHDNAVYTYGVTFVKGFLNFIMTFLGRLGISFPIYNTSTEMINGTQKFIYVFQDKTANAFTTMFMYFYLDFGIVGVVAGSLIFGGIIGQTYARLIRSQNNQISELRMAMFLLLMQALVKSIVRWEFVLMSFAMSFVVVRLFFNKIQQRDITANSEHL